jgi:hypothetical protein
VTGVGGSGVGGSGVGGSGVGGATGAGGSVSACGPNCQPPFMCNPATGACTCSESPSQACTRANIPCGYVIDNCGQQQFCPCQFANAVCDTNTNTCFTSCTTGVGGIVTSAMICPPPPAAN